MKNFKKGFTHTLTFKNKKKLVSGFTLIELLVVIAIIGILSAIVFTALDNSKSKAKLASVKSSLSSLSKLAEVYYYNGNTYTDVCSDNEVAKIMEAAAKVVGLTAYTSNGTGTGTTATCNDNSSAWAAEVPINSIVALGKGWPFINTVFAVPPAKMWCVDSTGNAKQTTASFGIGRVCP